MSQKINPISFRLGLLQVWNVTSALYGKNLKFSYFYQNLHLKKYLTKLFLDNGLLFDSMVKSLDRQNLTLFIKCNQINTKLKQFHNLKLNLLNFLKESTHKNQKLFLFKNNLLLNSSELISSYILYNIKKGLPVKEILKNVYNLVLKQLLKKKILVTVKGPLKLSLNGIKIQLKGRFENSRNQMSKLTSFRKGPSSLPNLKVYLEYTQINLYTKSGILNISIWLFYKSE